MAQQVKFYSVATLPQTPTEGALYFVDNGELYKGAQRFGLGRVTVASSTTGIQNPARGDVVVTGDGAGWVYAGSEAGQGWQKVGDDLTTLQGNWKSDFKYLTGGLAKGGKGSYITGIIQDTDGRIRAEASTFADDVKTAISFASASHASNGFKVTVGTSQGNVNSVIVEAPALTTGDSDGTVKLGSQSAEVAGWLSLRTDVSWLRSAITSNESGGYVVTAETGNFTNLNVSGTATFSATTVSASSLTVGGKTVATIADERIAAISAVTQSGESNGVTVNVTTEAGSVKTVAVTTTPVATIAPSGAGSDTVVSEKAVKAYVDGKFTALDNAMHFKGVVKALPTKDNKSGDIVVIDAAPTGKDPASKALVQGQEYIYNGSAWELIGDQNTYALNAYAPGDEKVTSGAATLPSAIHAVAAAVDTLNGEGEGSVKKALTDAIAGLDSTATGGTQGVAISVGQTDGKLNANATVTVTKETLNTTLGTTAVADKTVATEIGAGSNDALATTSAVKAAITAVELVWLGANGTPIA